MTVRSISFDDDDPEDLCVFSGDDLVTAHYDLFDLDWHEVGERSELDERRGLVITQVAVLEDLIDEFILYLVDPPDPEPYRRRTLDRKTIGPRLDFLERQLEEAGLLDQEINDLLTDIRDVVRRRNRLAHGTLRRRLVRIVPIANLAYEDIELEWVLVDRRSRNAERILMSELRADVHDAIGAFSAMLAYAERFVESAPHPKHFRGGAYLAAPTL